MAITTAPTLELPSSRRFTMSAEAQSFAVRSTSKVQLFRHRSVRLLPSSRDGRKFVLWCQYVLSRPVWLHPALPPTCRYEPHASPRCSPPCRALFGVRPHSPEITWNLPQPRSLSRTRFIASWLHLFMYPGTLCNQQHHPSSVLAYQFGKGLDTLPLRKRQGFDIRGSLMVLRAAATE